MTTIYRENAKRLSVADTKSLILDAVPLEKAVDIYAQVDDQGNINMEKNIVWHVNEKTKIQAAFLDNDFLATCNALGIRPRMKYRPVITDYAGKVDQDAFYTIAHDEFVRLAELFGLLVVMGKAPEPQATTDRCAPSLADGINYAMVATRAKLIAAFGAFTGMDDSWFTNLKDTPKLKNARKVAGSGGKDSTEPLFCPHEVMQWQTDPKKKKGGALTPEKGWQLLERHFPEVYNQYSIGDTRTD